MKTDKIILGLTGQSGAGKSTVGRILEQKGACVIDCDRLARLVVQPGKPALSEIVQAFGDEVLHPDGTMNRQKVASIVFHDADALHILNRITHKYIEEEVDRIMLSCPNRVIVIDAPVLFESGMEQKCVKTICVLAERETRIERIMKRDGITREKAEERIFAQHDDSFYIKRCDYVIYNDGDGSNLESAVDSALKEVLY